MYGIKFTFVLWLQSSSKTLSSLGSTLVSPFNAILKIYGLYKLFFSFFLFQNPVFFVISTGVPYLIIIDINYDDTFERYQPNIFKIYFHL